MSAVPEMFYGVQGGQAGIDEHLRHRDACTRAVWRSRIAFEPRDKPRFIVRLENHIEAGTANDDPHRLPTDETIQKTAAWLMGLSAQRLGHYTHMLITYKPNMMEKLMHEYAELRRVNSVRITRRVGGPARQNAHHVTFGRAFAVTPGGVVLG